MKFDLKPILTILIVTCSFSLALAQPANGIKVGTNYTFYKDNDITNFSPKIGYQFGYAWRIKLNELFALSVEGMFTQKSANVQTTINELNIYQDETRKANYLSAPIGMNYCFKNAYIGAGYEFGYMVSGNLPVNEKDHALFLQAAYKTRLFDVALKYAGTLNEEPGGTIVYMPGPTAQYTPKANTIQLSLIYNFGKK